MILSDDGRPIATGSVPDDGRDRPRGAIQVARSIDGDIAWTVQVDPDVILGKVRLNARIGDKEFVCRAAPCGEAVGAIWWQDGALYFLQAGTSENGGTTTPEIGRAHVCTPVTNAHLVCRLLLEKKKH